MSATTDHVETTPVRNKYQAVLVGCGSMSRGWLSAIQEHYSEYVSVHGFVDLNLENARSRAEESGAKQPWIGASLDEAIAKLSPDIVLNCTVPEAHAITCTSALQAGCHVLVEKPLAMTVEEGLRMAAASSDSDRCLAVIQNRRYLPGGETVRRVLADGTIGRIHTICADFFLGPRFGGFREKMAHPLLADMAIHTFDQARYLTGLDAVSVLCHEFNPEGSWFSAGASATAIFAMRGGAVFTYRGSWCAQGLPTSWESAWRIIGDRGTLLWDGHDKVTVERILPWDGNGFVQPVETLTFEVKPLEQADSGHAGNIGEFLRALDQGRKPQTRVEDNLQSLAMMEGAILSAEEDRRVTIDTLLGI